MSSHVHSAKKIYLSGTPDVVAKKLCGHEHFIFLDSSGFLEHQGKPAHSILGCNPTEVMRFEVSEYEVLQQRLLEKKKEVFDDEKSFPVGAAMGWFDYEGRAVFGFFDDLLVYDHEELQWYEVGETSKWFDCLDDEFCEAIRIDAFRASMTEEEFKKAVSEAKSLISKGIIYQVNLSIRYQAKTRGNHSYEMYEALRNSSPAPMSAFARLGDHEVLSSSPELFLRMQGSEVITKPIKGTCPRESDLEVDRLMVEKLKNSEKEKAELLMITDLLRNDLGKVCELGSVKVHKLLEVESFAQVHHLCSEIRGSLKVEHVAALAASLPGGSITGAPKLSAMKAIESLEPVERGVYTGSLGFFGYNGISQFNLLIRSLVLQAETLSYSVGAGIVTDSDEQAEYVETQQKALGIRKALIHFLSEPEVLQNQGSKVKLNRAECY